MNSKIKLFFFLYLLVINISNVYSQSFDSKNLTNTRNLDNYVNKSINNDLLTKNTLRLNALEKNLQNLWGRFETDLRDLKISIEKISNSMNQENGVSSKDLNLFKSEIVNLTDTIKILDQRIKRTFDLSNDVEFRVMRLEKRMKQLLSLLDEDSTEKIVDQDLIPNNKIPDTQIIGRDKTNSTVWNIEKNELDDQLNTLNKNDKNSLTNDLVKNNEENVAGGPISLTKMVNDDDIKNDDINNSLSNKEIDSKKTKPSILPNVSEEEQYRYALGRAIQNDYITAEKAFIEFKNLNPDHVRASDSLFWLGRVQFMQGFYEKSAMTFSEFNSMYSEDPRIPETTLLIAESVSNFASPKQACEIYDSLPQLVEKPTEDFFQKLNELSKKSKCKSLNAD